ncbi:HupE/UreJ family protein [Thioalkalivibrio sulfidiphilus]|uniref:HupE/UreJ family protein n=1 Tax=Thioalkalivibrio sulfidiphilus TaxID=1033854 RepID=UPI0003609F3F|nr:HupE/UreJ family protein [Thioalkalivibrio sulfidiphilus]
MRFALSLSLAVLCLLFASPAFAHILPDETGGLLAGLAHPVFGIDHLLALLAMGLWSAAMTGRTRLLIIPAVGLLMAASALAGLAGLALPYMETGIALSVLILGLMLSFALQQQVPGLLLIALFTLFHGNAHGLEAPSGVSLAAYFLGFALASLALVAAGQWLGRVVLHGPVLRLSGGVVALAGAWMLLG